MSGVFVMREDSRHPGIQEQREEFKRALDKALVQADPGSLPVAPLIVIVPGETYDAGGSRAVAFVYAELIRQGMDSEKAWLAALGSLSSART